MAENSEVIQAEQVLQISPLSEQSTNKTKINKKKEQMKETPVTPRGRPKSGRIWKNEKARFSSIVKTKGIRNSFERKEALRTELKRVKDASRAIIAGKKQEKADKKERRRENLRKREENRKKSEIVQVIKNPSKIKRMRKIQLRNIEKRDTNDLVNK